MKIKHLFPACIIITIILFNAVGLSAQNRHRGISSEDRNRIESHKIAFLTDKLDLSPAEAEKFWPVYNANRDRIDAERKRFKSAIDYNQDSIGQLTDEKANALLQTKLSHEEIMLDLKKEYIVALKKVLSPQKIVRLFEADREFREELIRNVSRKRGEQGRQ